LSKVDASLPTDVPHITEPMPIQAHDSTGRQHPTVHTGDAALQPGLWEAAMPRCESAASANKSWPSMHAKSITSLVVTVLLCLPSLIGGAALLMNLLLSKNIEQWQETSSALVALGVFVGGPLVTLAAVVGGIVALSRSVSVQMKCAHLFVVGLAAVAALSLLFRFGA
jgi:hypothetical protein